MVPLAPGEGSYDLRLRRRPKNRPKAPRPSRAIVAGSGSTENPLLWFTTAQTLSLAVSTPQAPRARVLLPNKGSSQAPCTFVAPEFVPLLPSIAFTHCPLPFNQARKIWPEAAAAAADSGHFFSGLAAGTGLTRS